MTASYSSASSKKLSRATKLLLRPLPAAISPSCLIKAGHVYEKLGKYDKAIALYNEVKTKYYTTPEAESVEADLLRAQAQGK